MIKIFFVLGLFLSINTYSKNLKSFSYKEFIKASDINNNFKYFNHFFSNGYSNQFNSGQLIKKEDLNNTLNNLQNCSFNGLSSNFITSLDFNNLFSNINCIFPSSSYFNSYFYENIPYLKPDNLSWTIDGDLNTGTGYRNLDVYMPSISNGKVIVYFHSLTMTKSLSTSFLNSLKNNFINKGYIFISVEFRHPAVEGYSNIEDQFDIAKSLNFIKEMSNFSSINNDEIYIVGYSKGSLSLANIIDSRYSNYSDSVVKKIYLLDAQVTYNEQKYYDLFMDKNQVNYGFFNISARDGFSTLNDGAKAFSGLQLLDDLTAVDTYLSVYNTTNMQSQSKLPSLRLGYNYQYKGRLLKLNEVLTSVIPFEIDPVGFDYLLHNPESISIICNEYNLYGNCTGIDNLNFNGTTIINDIDNFFSN